MRLRQFDSLRNFVIIAQHDSLASAAEELCLTKGALSHQLHKLEAELGFDLFERHPRGIRLTHRGRELLSSAQIGFEQIERSARTLASHHERTLTIGVTTYFASRWLSPRLTEFMRAHPDIRLRIQPMISLRDFSGEGADLAIRWGKGTWRDCQVEPLFLMPVAPTGNRTAFEQVQKEGLQAAFASFTLLHDQEHSTAWADWHKRAKLPFKDQTEALIIPDPNVRVQAVLDGQGVALNDALVEDEISRGALFRLGPMTMADYGYFLVQRSGSGKSPEVSAFTDWLRQSALQSAR